MNGNLGSDKKMYLKVAEEEDIQKLYELRIDVNPEWFKTGNKFSIKDHTEWFKNRKHRLDLLCFYYREFVGWLQISKLNTSNPELGIHVPMHLHNRGFGTIIIKKSLEVLRLLGYNRCFCIVHKDNVECIQVFTNNGFEYDAQKHNDVWLHYSRNII